MLIEDHVLYSCDGTAVWWSETPSLVTLSKVSLLLNVLKACWNHLVCWHTALLLKQEVKGSSCLYNWQRIGSLGEGHSHSRTHLIGWKLAYSLECRMSLIFKRKKLHFVRGRLLKDECFHGGDLKTNRRGLKAASHPLLLFRLRELETKLRKLNFVICLWNARMNYALVRPWGANQPDAIFLNIKYIPHMS